MTEGEAQNRWCPMRRITRIGDVRIDNTDGKEFTLNCIGSHCMMWRWERVESHGTYAPKMDVCWVHAGRIYACEPQRPDWMNAQWQWDDTKGVWRIGDPPTNQGYCGLAGA